MKLEVRIDISTLSNTVGKYIIKRIFNMKTGYVDTIIEERMKDDRVKADMLNEKAKLDLAVSLMKARENAKLTQSDLAKLVGTSQNAISRVENGNGNPSLKTLTRIAEALNQPLAIRFGN